MLDAIKALYGPAVAEDLNSINDPESYYWFKTESGMPFGIKKAAVSEKEYRLLTLTFQPLTTLPKSLTDEERIWHECLFLGKKNHEVFTDGTSRYLLHIQLKSSLSDPDAFREAIQALFDQAPVILWKNEETVILVLLNRPDAILAEEFIQILATDFYADVRLFIGTALNGADSAHALYTLEEKAFALARKVLPEKRIYVFEKVLPLVMLTEVPKEIMETAYGSLFQVLKDGDPEWVKSLSTFFEHGMNMKQAAKALFIHRNSLQYRLDKFTERTGLDPRQFDEALFIYLGLLAEKLL